jgi:alkanesulfonate monooxygenase SsuD/methylene tetrahydromethanopterin reductase-like flavin-dependent oxidoreductase (luciferase family)
MAAGDPRARDYGPDRRNRLVTDERAELIRELRRLAAAHGLRPAVRAYRADGLVITPRPVVHTSHPPYLIGASGTRTAWAPEFLEFPSWAGADLMFAEAGWRGPSASSRAQAGTLPHLW